MMHSMCEVFFADVYFRKTVSGEGLRLWIKFSMLCHIRRVVSGRDIEDSYERKVRKCKICWMKYMLSWRKMTNSN